MNKYSHQPVLRENEQTAIFPQLRMNITGCMLIIYLQLLWVPIAARVRSHRHQQSPAR